MWQVHFVLRWAAPPDQESGRHWRLSLVTVGYVLKKRGQFLAGLKAMGRPVPSHREAGQRIKHRDGGAVPFGERAIVIVKEFSDFVYQRLLQHAASTRERRDSTRIA
jgi:hypothetical protein